MKLVFKLLTIGSASLSLLSSNAATITFTGSSGIHSASAVFTQTPGFLTISIRNTATYDAMVPTDMLTALFFNVPNLVTFSPVSALVGSSSTVINTLTGNPNYLPGGTVVGGEWAYAGGLNVGGLNGGTSSTGLGLFGAGNFPGPNLQGPASVDGVQYGITTAGDIASTGNGGITSAQSSQFIKNEVVLTLSSIPINFNLSQITSVRFQYGTSVDEFSMTGTGDSPSVPDGGSTLLLLGSALVGFGALRRKFAR
jgi:hypothetical protein